MSLLISYNGYLTSLNVSTLPPIVINEIVIALSYKDRASSYLKSQVLSYRYPQRNWGSDSSDRVIKLYTLKNAVLSFPTGILHTLVAILYRYNIQFQVTWVGGSKITPGLLPDTLPVEPYDYQISALQQALSLKRTIIKALPGSGKTYLSYMITQCFPTENIVILAPSKDSAHNLYSTFSKYMDVGIVEGGKCKIKRVTIALKSIGLIIRKKQKNHSVISDYLKQCTVWLYDEVHEYGNSLNDKEILAHSVNAYYKIGLTATPVSSVSNLILEQHVAPVGVELSPKNLNITIPKCFAVRVPRPNPIGLYQTSSLLEVSDLGGLLYTKDIPPRDDVYRQGLVGNMVRNTMIAEIAVKYCQTNMADEFPCLIVVSLIEHGVLIKEIIKQKGLEVDFVTGSNSKNERSNALDSLRHNNNKCLIGSSIFKFAVDIPNLGMVINASGGSSPYSSQQIAGRVTRKVNGKQPIVIDFDDEERFYLNKNSRTRIKNVASDFETEFKRVELWELLEQLALM